MGLLTIPRIRQIYLTNLDTANGGLAHLKNEGTEEQRGIPAPWGQLTPKKKKIG